MTNFFECEKLKIDLNICTKCQACVRDCPVRIYIIKDNTLCIQDFADKKCMECGHCVAVCQVNAITLKNYSDTKEIPKDLEIPSYEELMNIFQIRRSIRQFKSKPIPEELWHKLLDAAKAAPTGHNFQELHFTIVRTPAALERVNNLINKNFQNLVDTFEDKERWIKLTSVMSEKRAKLVAKIIPGLRKSFERIANGDDPWRWGGELMIIHGPTKPTTLVQDCSIAATYVMLSAISLGLGTCSLDLVCSVINQYKPLAKYLKIPKGHNVPYVLAIGHPSVKYHRIPARLEAPIKWF